MDKKGVKDGRAQKAQINLAHNHEILGMLKSCLKSAYEITKQFWSKETYAKLK